MTERQDSAPMDAMPAALGADREDKAPPVPRAINPLADRLLHKTTAHTESAEDASDGEADPREDHRRSPGT